MDINQIQGNDSVRRALVEMVDAGRVPHAIMFHENDGGGAVELCLAFLEYLMKSPKVGRLIHPDVHFVFPVTGGSIIPSSAKPTSLSYIKEWRQLISDNPHFTERDLNEALGIEGKSAIIAIAEARAILDKLSFNSLEGGYQAVIIYLPEKMNQETANRLLKSIEEPPEKTEFLLITHAPEKVLVTISSRCQNIRLTPPKGAGAALGAQAEEERELWRTLLDALRERDLMSALEAGEAFAALPSRERMKSLCREAGESCRQMFLLQQGLPGDGSMSGYAQAFKKTFPRNALALLDKAQGLIERNVNPKTIFCDLVDRLYLLI